MATYTVVTGDIKEKVQAGSYEAAAKKVLYKAKPGSMLGLITSVHLKGTKSAEDKFVSTEKFLDDVGAGYIRKDNGQEGK